MGNVFHSVGRGHNYTTKIMNEKDPSIQKQLGNKIGVGPFWPPI